MTRDLRLYFWIIGIPVILVAVGGLRLLYVEAARARVAEENSLQAKAESTTRSFSGRMREKIDFLLNRLSSLPDDAALHVFSKDDYPLMTTAFRWVEGKGLLWPSKSSTDPVERMAAHRLTVPLGPNSTWPFVRSSHESQTKLPSGWKFIPGEKDASVLAWVRVSSNEVRGVEIARETLKQAFLQHVESLGLNSSSSATPHATVVSIVDFLGQEVLSPSGPIRGQMCGRSPLGRLLPDWTLCVYWRDGDWPLAGEMSTMVCLGVCLLVLLVSSLLGGAVLLVRSAQKAHSDLLKKTDFVSTVTHELKTPLTTIRLCADLIESGAITDEAGVRRAAHSIVLESDRLSRIVTNVLTLGRLELKRQQLSLEDVALAPLIRELATTVPGFAYNLSVPEDLSVHAERLALQGILFNLFENAVKYAAAGGPVDVEAEPAPKDQVLLHVKDRGPGMTKDEMTHAFDQFWRADNSVVRETGGVGLGLSIARGLTRRMGGDLTVSSRAGGGCVFTLNLPVAKSTAEGDSNG